MPYRVSASNAAYLAVIRSALYGTSPSPRHSNDAAQLEHLGDQRLAP